MVKNLFCKSAKINQTLKSAICGFADWFAQVYDIDDTVILNLYCAAAAGKVFFFCLYIVNFC